MSTAPVSLSVYRGQQSHPGRIGEGPGRPVTQGEQYLEADAPLDRDADLLDAIRPWMSLDSDPADHQTLADRLESWSFFAFGNRQLVARLVSAGIYDRRAAYFAHGRLWPLDAGPGFDPGLHIGRSEAFETPWRDDDPGRRVPELEPAFTGVEQVRAEAEVAALFLGHLLQSAVRGRPLVVMAPLSEFAVGAPLHTLVSFARGALPADLRQKTRVRIYTRTPELFLRDSGPALIAMPEDMEERVKSFRRDARLIDRQGMARSGEPLEPAAQEYARAVVRRAGKTPRSLTRFGERFRDRHSRAVGELPADRDVIAVPITYNLADALAGSPEDRAAFVGSFLPQIAPRLGPVLDWQQLISIEEWQEFPLDAVLALLLQDSRDMEPGMREIQKAVERAARLKHAMERGEVDRFRVQTILQTAPASRLAAVTREILQVPGLFEEQGPWGDVLARLLEVLRRLDGLPSDLAAVLVQSLVHEGTLRHRWLVSLAPQWIEHEDLLKALGVDALLELAGVLEAEQSLRTIFTFVDIHMRRNPRSSADALIRTGWWTAWRRMSALMAHGGEEKHRAAEAWLGSLLWTVGGAREATREDWNQVMDDLPASLYRASRPAPWSHEEEPRRLWPWIPPFEEEQIADLADRAPDLPSLALLVDFLQKDFSRPDVGIPFYRFALRSSRFKPDFENEDALARIVDNPPAGLPPLSLKDSFQLWKMAGPRAERAVHARLASIYHCLEKDVQAKEAIYGADEPSLWDKPQFAQALAFWMHKQWAGDRIDWEIAEKIHRQIDAEPLRRPKEVNRRLVEELVRRKLEKCAALLDPDLPGLVVLEDLVESAVGAMADGAHDHPCWKMLADRIETGSTDRHLLSWLAERVRSQPDERRAALVRNGWRTFEAAAHKQPWLTHLLPDQADLPVFDLAASLSTPGGLGTAALGVIFLANASQKKKLEWWESLLREFFRWRRYSPSLSSAEDRRDVAMALVVRHLADLDSEERQVFWNALGQRNEWDQLVGAR